MQSGLYQPEKLTMVDNEWHIFSAYRAIFGIGYPEIVALRDAAAYEPGTFDTVFFPGCSLVSYAPDLTRRVGEWLTAAGFKWCMSDDCCGSPLMSVGFFDRAAAHREKIFEQIKAAGITRMVTVCPGCGEEFAELMADDIDIIPLPELILERGREMERAAGVALRADGMPEDVDAAVRAAGLLLRACLPSPCSTHAMTVTTGAMAGRFVACCAAYAAGRDSRDGRAPQADAVLRGGWRRCRLRPRHHGSAVSCAWWTKLIRRARTRSSPCAPPARTPSRRRTCPQRPSAIDSHNYLELFFGQTTTGRSFSISSVPCGRGEYGPWLECHLLLVRNLRDSHRPLCKVNSLRAEVFCDLRNASARYVLYLIEDKYILDVE